VKSCPLKNKTLTYEQDYIESDIKWKLKLGDEIFKKSDIKQAVFWLKSEMSKNFNKEQTILLKKMFLLINESFNDAIKTNRKALK